MRCRVFIVVALLALTLSVASAASVRLPRSQADAPTCGLDQPAFCDPLNQAAGDGNRAGQLDGVVWGVSRTSQDSNPGQGRLDNWAPSTLRGCGDPRVLPENDHQICGGQLAESSNDNGNYTVSAMYPKQPFDFAGRTGSVAFDVDTFASGPHGAWPEFAITDKPTPAPSHAATTQASYAQNQVGFSLAAACGTNDNCGTDCPASSRPGVTVDEMYAVRDNVYADLPFVVDGCVLARPGTLSHFLVRISQDRLVVYASDAGSDALKPIAHADTIDLRFSRGLIWLEDVHYNAAKEGQPFDADHTFHWANVGFDGPLLPRDLAYDVPDALIHAGDGTVELGYAVNNLQATTLSVENVAAPSLASAALLTLNFFAHEPRGFEYRVNGGAWQTFAWPFDNETYVWRTAALPLPLADVAAGTNTIDLRLDAADSWAFANIDLILVGAGGLPAPPGG